MNEFTVSISEGDNFQCTISTGKLNSWGQKITLFESKEAVVRYLQAYILNNHNLVDVPHANVVESLHQAGLRYLRMDAQSWYSLSGMSPMGTHNAADMECRYQDMKALSD